MVRSHIRSAAQRMCERTISVNKLRSCILNATYVEHEYVMLRNKNPGAPFLVKN